MEDMINIAIDAYTETIEETKHILQTVWNKIVRKGK